MASAQTERRLAAIMFTDVVGSTATTARSEAAGLELRDRHRQLVQAQVEPNAPARPSEPSPATD